MSTKVLESKAVIRFPDCDPFNHLNNARYIDYLINAREDHLLKNYGFHIYQYAKEKGVSWLVAQNLIAYMKPATLMETVAIQSTAFSWSEKNIWVEMRMWNEPKTILKALLWTKFVHFNLVTQKTETHSEELNKIFDGVINPFPSALTFDERLDQLKGKTAEEIDHV